VCVLRSPTTNTFTSPTLLSVVVTEKTNALVYYVTSGIVFQLFRTPRHLIKTFSRPLQVVPLWILRFTRQPVHRLRLFFNLCCSDPTRTICQHASLNAMARRSAARRAAHSNALGRGQSLQADDKTRAGIQAPAASHHQRDDGLSQSPERCE
jgi:hypothetical protein